ncbi:MAG: type I DNA topoisomerase [Acidimicrobiia bacterium]|nr:type I DNA topoisomerase [Acidimicrobiia bacterium]
MPTKLVIVESPAKARTIAGFLGKGFVVESSIGHIRDLPESSSEIPNAYRGEPWARLGVDVDNDFKPLYVVPADKKKQVTRLKQLLKDADEVYLATDEDREGESIAWHLLEVLKPKQPVQRMVFHEITRAAIRQAMEHPRQLDRRLVDAQEARRILDRLYGYEVSPVLWRKVRQGLSAGRVQSPATRIIVERERERMAFVSASYWGLTGTFTVADDPTAFEATLATVYGERVATGTDFADDGSAKSARAARLILDESTATSLAAGLANARFTVVSVEAKPYTRRPYPPFRTATLQQEAGRKLRFAARRAMAAAQRLYEAGYITYMRTDSVTLAASAVDAARNLVADRYGSAYLPGKPRMYTSAVKNAQEAHEAIRPAGDRFTEPATMASALGPGSDEARLYDLIWKRTVASQMKDAVGESIAARLGATSADGRPVEFVASGLTITFPGFLRAYVEGRDDPDAALDDQERPLPPMRAEDPATAVSIDAEGHQTKPPARYTEASLVKRLEELGIGRPSTYASIISTIQDRGYVFKKATALVPTLTAFATIGLLETHFEDLVDYAFTARMEDDLDDIAAGDKQSIPWLKRFYFGNGRKGLHDLVQVNLDAIDPRLVNAIPIGVDADGEPVVARVGRYGPYLKRGEDTASIPEDLAPDELTIDKAMELLSMPSGDRQLGHHPDTGEVITLRHGRYGPYVQLGEADPDAKPKQTPRRSSLFKAMTSEAVSLADAIGLLQIPRIVGEHPEGGEVSARNGRYGPYLQWGKETRSLDAEDELLTITLDEAIAKLAQPKQARRAAASLRQLGPTTEGTTIHVRDGRFGPYVTDGETNASLRAADTVEGITLERAVELIAERKAKGPGKPKPKPKARKRAGPER